MLSNIASVEIPPLPTSLLDWLKRQDRRALDEMGVPGQRISERAFVPRLALGRYLRDQFDAVVARGRASGYAIDVRTDCPVVDAENTPSGMRLTIAPRSGATERLWFDHVVLATGHQWPMSRDLGQGYFRTPWPASKLAGVPPVHVGIRGTSLTAIDAAVALANIHGAFAREEGRMTYRLKPGADSFRMTMMSRKGLLPEADFYFPLPHTPLSICTPEAIARLVEAGKDGLLDAAFDLFRQELLQVDPGYGLAVGLAGSTLEAFGSAYFARRAAADPFAWAADNLDEARRNHASRVTVPWRDAILRMHDVLAAVVPHLDAEDFNRFHSHLKPVFVDGYGAVPHESIERILALHQAGRLEIIALGDDYRVEVASGGNGASLHQGADRIDYPVFIEATGQRALGALQFPFLSLIQQGVVRDQASSDDGSPRGIAIDDGFQVVADGLPPGRLFCLSLPFILGSHPFIQGLTSSHGMGVRVAKQLAKIVGRTTRRLNPSGALEAA